MKLTKTILAIETSCDETGAALVRGRFRPGEGDVPESVCVASQVVHSQIASHQPFGGVVPEVAARDHLAKIAEVAEEALAALAPTEHLDAVAVTMGPGLIGALLVGILYARGFSIGRGIPLLAVNHVDAHLAPALLFENYSVGSQVLVKSLQYPALALTVSGGHCHLSRLEGPHARVLLGRTVDDAAGEAFDKVAKVLGLVYPGGPQVERLAAQVSGARFSFPCTLTDKSNRLGFSFSGLKTAVLFAVKDLLGLKQIPKSLSGASLPEDVKAELAWAFQEAALGQLRDRLVNALADSPIPIRSVAVAGGVAANSRFRAMMAELGLPVRFAPLALCSDNAAMIGLQALLEPREGLRMQPFTRYAMDMR